MQSSLEATQLVKWGEEVLGRADNLNYRMKKNMGRFERKSSLYWSQLYLFSRKTLSIPISLRC